MPKGLIPLMLSSPDATSSFSSSRSSVLLRSPNRVSFSPTSPLSPAFHKRNQSDTPIIKLSRPPVRAGTKRQSQQLPASLPQIPYSPAEWKRAISEIKRYHVTRRYRACSARCNEILTNIRNNLVIEPAYLIYLNFYAASSLEMCARPLATASAYRLSLLQQARTHYDRAAALIRAAEDDTALLLQRTRSASAASSFASSQHSPSNSVTSASSRSCWTPESGVTTPTTCSLSRKSSLNAGTALTVNTATSRSSGAAPGRSTKKKVSFDLSVPRNEAAAAEDEDEENNDADSTATAFNNRWSFIGEPAIRPDSPTLGFEEDYFTAGTMRQELPELPPAQHNPQYYSSTSSSPPFPSDTIHMPSISERDEANSPANNNSDVDEPPSACSSSSDDDYHPFFAFPVKPRCSQQQQAAEAAAVAAARERYAETLAVLKLQVARHTAALEEVLAQDLQGGSEGEVMLHDGSRAAAAVPGVWRTSLLQGEDVSYRRASYRQSVGDGSVCGGRDSCVLAGLGEEGEMGESSEEKMRDRKARIDRLKVSGWRRKRFDASRYEDLCDVVMAELNHV